MGDDISGGLQLFKAEEYIFNKLRSTSSTEALTHRGQYLGDGLKLCKTFATLDRGADLQGMLGVLELCKAKEHIFD